MIASFSNTRVRPRTIRQQYRFKPYIGLRVVTRGVLVLLDMLRIEKGSTPLGYLSYASSVFFPIQTLRKPIFRVSRTNLRVSRPFFATPLYICVSYTSFHSVRSFVPTGGRCTEIAISDIIHDDSSAFHQITSVVCLVYICSSPKYIFSMIPNMAS